MSTQSREEALEAALRELLDEQNGPPLINRAQQWQAAVEAAESALALPASPPEAKTVPPGSVQRAQFEMYAQQMGLRDFEENEFGDYRNPHTQHPWNFWRASRAALAARPAPPEALCEDECGADGVHERLCAAAGAVMAHQWSHNREAMAALTRLVDEAARAAAELERLRTALARLVRVYVIDGAATTPASEVGAAWQAAQRALAWHEAEETK